MMCTKNLELCMKNIELCTKSIELCTKKTLLHCFENYYLFNKIV